MVVHKLPATRRAAPIVLRVDFMIRSDSDELKGSQGLLCSFRREVGPSLVLCLRFRFSLILIPSQRGSFVSAKRFGREAVRLANPEKGFLLSETHPKSGTPPKDHDDSTGIHAHVHAVNLDYPPPKRYSGIYGP